MVLGLIIAALVILAVVWYLVIKKLKKSKEIATISLKRRKKYICMYCGDEFNEGICPKCGRDTKVPL